MVRPTMWKALLDRLPRGNTLDEKDWLRRHRINEWLLFLHIPGLAIFGLVRGFPPGTVGLVLLAPAVLLGLGHLLQRSRRLAAVLVTGGLVYCSAALVGLSGGSIEAHFHFFIIIGFIALYQDWAPFLFNILFTVISHGVGSIWQQSLIFSHPAGQTNPWVWSLIHGAGVLMACVGMMLFWRVTEESQQEKAALVRQLAETEIGRRQFTSDLLVNLARRNQSMLYRQLDIINQLEESEQDPDALAELFRLDHLATRVRRNAESLLVLSGEQPARVWSEPVPLRDVVRAAIAETEDLERVVFTVDERVAVAGHSVTDLTHLLAELTENAVRFSPPDTMVTIRARADRQDPGGQLLTVEDWGVGMPEADIVATNTLLAEPSDVDLAVSQRLGFHVVARLAARHGIRVGLSATPGSGITAVVALPSSLFEAARPVPSRPSAAVPLPRRTDEARRPLAAAGAVATLEPPAPSVQQTPSFPGAPSPFPGVEPSFPAAGRSFPAGDAASLHAASFPPASFPPGPFPAGSVPDASFAPSLHPAAHNGTRPAEPPASGATGRSGRWIGWWGDSDGSRAPANGDGTGPAGPGFRTESAAPDRPDEHGADRPAGQTPAPLSAEFPPAADLRREVPVQRSWPRPDQPAGPIGPAGTGSIPAPGGSLPTPGAADPLPAALRPSSAPVSVPRPTRKPSPVAAPPAAARATGSPAPAPAGDAMAALNGLQRRVPQASLAPELRQPTQQVAEPAPVPIPDAMTALSRYQASRRAALVGDERPDQGRGR